MSEDHKKKRTRSPAYPAFGLEDCIAKARTLYDAEDRHPMPIEVAAEHWEYKATSSGAAQAISSLKQFGLLAEDSAANGGARLVKLTPEALAILVHEADAPERIAAIKAAALAPKIHRELWDKDGGRLGSDSALRIYLTLKREQGLFNKDAVDDFIKQFRATLAFAKVVKSDTVDETEDSENNEETGVSALLPPRDETAVVRDFPIPLIGGGIAVVKVPVPMSEADFAQLTGTLQAWKAALVREPTKSHPLNMNPKRKIDLSEDEQ